MDRKIAVGIGRSDQIWSGKWCGGSCNPRHGLLHEEPLFKSGTSRLHNLQTFGGGHETGSVWMVKKLLEMRKNKNPYVKVDEEQGTLNIALGFTHKGFNHDFLPDETDTTAPMTVMMYVHDKDVQELYIGVSGVADAGTKFAKFYASRDGNVYYGDDFWTSVAGVILRNLMGALCSCFEGITIAVTILGTINGGIKNYGSYFDMVMDQTTNARVTT